MNYLWIILGLFFLVCSIFFLKKRYLSKKIDRKEAVSIIERFVNGTSNDYEWDDFISVPISDLELEKIRVRCANLPEEFPPRKEGEYCNEEGVKILRGYVVGLKKQQK